MKSQAAALSPVYRGCCCFSPTWSGITMCLLWLMLADTDITESVSWLWHSSNFSFLVKKKKNHPRQWWLLLFTAGFTVIICFFLVWITWVLWSKGTAVAFHVITCTIWANLNKFYQSELNKNYDSYVMKTRSWKCPLTYWNKRIRLWFWDFYCKYI